MLMTEGPTEQRLKKTQGFFHVGDDKRGNKIYQLCDNPLDRLYARLVKRAGQAEEKDIRREYAALLRYRMHWHSAGLEASIPSVDLDRVFASDASNMSGMPKSERQAYHRKQYRDAQKYLKHRVGIVVDNVVCAEHTLEDAGFAVGWLNRVQAIAAATEIIRNAGSVLALLWDID